MTTAPYLSSLFSDFGIMHGFGGQDWNYPRQGHASAKVVDRVARHIGSSSAVPLFLPDQVHKDRIVVVDDTLTVDRVSQIACDALITERQDIVVGVRTADCVPILIGSHSGIRHGLWRSGRSVGSSSRSVYQRQAI